VDGDVNLFGPLLQLLVAVVCVDLVGEFAEPRPVFVVARQDLLRFADEFFECADVGRRIAARR
jgi:hypothetical protein